MTAASRRPGVNWAGNYAYQAGVLQLPKSMEQLHAILARGTKVHVLGSRHSFNGVADSEGELISLESMEPTLELGADRTTVIVGGGVRYGVVGEFLARQGLSLRNFASLPHISVAGAVSTASHGSGDRNASLAADVRAIDMMLASGEVWPCSTATLGDDFLGVVASLGALGVIVRVTLETVPAFRVRQDVYENLGWSQFEESFDDITASAYSVSMFTDFGAGGINQVWLKSCADTDSDLGASAPSDLFGAKLATRQHHPVPGQDAVNATQQLGIPGAAHDRLPHFRIGFTPSSGAELQSEYLIDRRDIRPAVRAVRGLGARIAELGQIAEIRTIAPDELWLSPSRGRDTVALHFTWMQQTAAVRALLGDLESRLAPFGARPHWGKLFVGDSAYLREAYPLLSRFGELAQRWDPSGRFRNDFLERHVFGTAQ